MIQASVSHDWAIHRQSKYLQPNGIELLCRDELSADGLWAILENLWEKVSNSAGQFILLDLAEPQTETLFQTLYIALKNVRWEQSLQFSLPTILQHNPRTSAPFINRAILWQRLCDLLLLDDDPHRETVLVLENIDKASPAVQHDIARLIRFHETHSISRTFVFTLENRSCCQITPELRSTLEI